MNFLSCITYEGRLEIFGRLSLVAAHPAPLTLCVTLGVACILRAILLLLPAPGALLPLPKAPDLPMTASSSAAHPTQRCHAATSRPGFRS